MIGNGGLNKQITMVIILIFFLSRTMSEEIRSRVKSFIAKAGGLVTLGESSTYNWIDDPTRLLFSLSRYKFVARALEGSKKVLEVGAGDGMGSYLVSKYVAELVCVDIDKELIKSARETVSRYATNIKFEAGDIQDRTFLRSEAYDGIFLLDVLEHIDKDIEDQFIGSLTSRMSELGTMIIGMPSIESQVYASSLSKIGHINCKSQDNLRDLCKRHFHKVFMFGANDEIIHTGFPGMQHYRIALCVLPKSRLQL
jgi:2-polyprenyl-3-methyl-5-hydroxy-6-metoxy-1,4-benzoquinol methylase